MPNTVYHLYVVQMENREAMHAKLARESIGTGIHYLVPLHLQKAYGNLGYGPGDFPLCESAAKRILSLPVFPGLSEADQVRVVDVVVRSAQRTQAQNALAM
jgi:dTDP-4-amino-4,6-dideoxygalactose transaminase